MQKYYQVALFLSLILLISCGTPNDPESIIGGDGGYKIVSKYVTSGYAQDVVINGNLAFVAQGEGGLMIINITNPSAPIELSTVAQELKGYGYKIANKDSVVYIAAGGFGVSVVDASNPSNPVVTATNLAMKPAKSFDIMGNFLFTAISEYGFKECFCLRSSCSLDLRFRSIHNFEALCRFNLNVSENNIRVLWIRSVHN